MLVGRREKEIKIRKLVTWLARVSRMHRIRKALFYLRAENILTPKGSQDIACSTSSNEQYDNDFCELGYNFVVKVISF